MTHSLPSNPDIQLLKKQAKKLLKLYRAHSAEAVATIDALHPKPASFSGLRDAQLVIARNYGFDDWADLSNAVTMANDGSKSLAEKTELFIKLGCVQYSGNDTLRNYRRANSLLRHYPNIAQQNFYSALVANAIDLVEGYLQSNPKLATETGGPLNWPPLLYSTYSRIEEPADTRNSLKIVQRLLELGASPDAHIILYDTYRFTALTGAMGEGEQGANQPPHQYADELVQLLLDAGANLNEGQGLYNTMFTDSGDKWLALLISKGLNSDSRINWDTDNSTDQISTLDYQLTIAVDRGKISRIQMLLEAGASANTKNSYSGKAVHTHALLKGYDSIASLLREYGAIPQPLIVADQFRVACAQGRKEQITTLLQHTPELVKDVSLLHDAAHLPDTGIYKYLISLGFDIDGQANYGRTILHHFALNNDVDQIQYLLDSGARIDICDSSHSSTAVGFAAYTGSSAALKLLLNRSDSFLDCVSCAYMERASHLLAENPGRISERDSLGNTALHLVGLWLHEEPDYDVCGNFLDFLLGAGAEIRAVNYDEQTPAEFFLSKGAENIAELLVERGG